MGAVLYPNHVPPFLPAPLNIPTTFRHMRKQKSHAQVGRPRRQDRFCQLARREAIDIRSIERSLQMIQMQCQEVMPGFPVLHSLNAY